MIIETGTRSSAPGLVGGRVCLDFANTMHGRLSDEPRDDLQSYAELVSWGQRAGVTSAREAQRLRREAGLDPQGANAVLARAKVLRDALYGIFSAIADGRAPGAADLAILNNEISTSLGHLQLAYGEGGFRRSWAEEARALDRLLWPIAHSAENLLTSDALSTVRVCDLELCTWLFIDTSKNRRRRWCDMKTCGNRAKFRRFYERARATRTSKAPAPG